MAIYSLDTSSNAAVGNSIKAALTSAGILTATHYQSNEFLIVTTTRSNKVIKILTHDASIRVYIGDAHTSDTTITNEVPVNSYADWTAKAEANLVVTDHVLYMGYRMASNGRTSHALFGRLDSATEEYVALGWITNAIDGTQALRDTTNNTQMEISQLRNVLISAGGYYYVHDMIVANNANVLLASAVQGVKFLQRSYVYGSHIITYGNDVAVSGGGANGTVSYFPQSLLIEDGNSWEPA
jgi:hypothetical protein